MGEGIWFVRPFGKEYRRPRVDNGQPVVADNPGKPTQRRAAHHVALQLAFLVFVIDGDQRSKTGYIEVVQVTEIKDQRSLQLRKAADRPCYQVGVGGVDFAADPQDGGQAPRVNTQLCGRVERTPNEAAQAARLTEQPAAQAIRASSDAGGSCGVFVYWLSSTDPLRLSACGPCDLLIADHRPSAHCLSVVCGLWP